MLQGINGRSQQHKEMLLRMAVAALQKLSKMHPAAKLETGDDLTSK